MSSLLSTWCTSTSSTSSSICLSLKCSLRVKLSLSTNLCQEPRLPLTRNDTSEDLHIPYIYLYR